MLYKTFLNFIPQKQQKQKKLKNKKITKKQNKSKLNEGFLPHFFVFFHTISLRFFVFLREFFIFILVNFYVKYRKKLHIFSKIWWNGKNPSFQIFPFSIFSLFLFFSLFCFALFWWFSSSKKEGGLSKKWKKTERKQKEKKRKKHSIFPRFSQRFWSSFHTFSIIFYL